MNRQPSAYAMERALSVLKELRFQLMEIDPSIGEDETLLIDMLDGEGGDAMQILERLIDSSIEANVLADAAKARRADLAERQARFERRRDIMRTMAQSALEALEIRKLERAEWTASLANRPPKVVITDESLIPDEFMRVRREPDKAALLPKLKAGHTVDGAELSNGGIGITIRTK